MSTKPHNDLYNVNFILCTIFSPFPFFVHQMMCDILYQNMVKAICGGNKLVVDTAHTFYFIWQYWYILEGSLYVNISWQSSNKNCETHFRGKGLQISSWFLTSIWHVSETFLKCLQQFFTKFLRILLKSPFPVSKKTLTNQDSSF